MEQKADTRSIPRFASEEEFIEWLRESLRAAKGQLRALK
jgi:hypothetical protein